MAIGLPQLVGIWFQVLLTPLIGVLFIVQSPYFPLSVVEEYLALEGGPPCFTQSSTGSVLLWYAGNMQGSRLRIQDYHLLWSDFPDRSACDAFVTAPAPEEADYRRPQPQEASPLVWALPLSLAATYGVSVDFLSCRYLDVSVPCVRLERPMHSAADDGIWLPSSAGLPHSEIPGLAVARHLPRAYRSLPRPSSPLDA